MPSVWFLPDRYPLGSASGAGLECIVELVQGLHTSYAENVFRTVFPGVLHLIGSVKQSPYNS